MKNWGFFMKNQRKFSAKLVIETDIALMATFAWSWITLIIAVLCLTQILNSFVSFWVHCCFKILLKLEFEKELTPPMHSEGRRKAVGSYQVALGCKLLSSQPCPVLLKQNVVLEEEVLMKSVVGRLAASRAARRHAGISWVMHQALGCVDVLTVCFWADCQHN